MSVFGCPSCLLTSLPVCPSFCLFAWLSLAVSLCRTVCLSVSFFISTYHQQQQPFRSTLFACLVIKVLKNVNGTFIALLVMTTFQASHKKVFVSRNATFGGKGRVGRSVNFFYLVLYPHPPKSFFQFFLASQESYQRVNKDSFGKVTTS